jgi:hypothetical protein
VDISVSLRYVLDALNEKARRTGLEDDIELDIRMKA